MSWYNYGFPRYVSAAERRAKAQRELKKLEKNGRKTAPVMIDGKKIASTFWGKAWCDHLESYSDYENRLPRGRTYVRNGSVLDLRIEPGQVTALVSGSSLYNVSIKIKPLAANCWDGIKRDCAGSIGSLIELLQGKLSKAVMERVTRRDGGMFPAPAEITKTCSCPDWAGMCKHVAAVLYGVGARLDRQPELLFVLRKVDHLKLIEKAGNVDDLVRADGSAAAQKTLADDQLADVFGIDFAPDASSATSPAHAQTGRADWPKPAKRATTKPTRHPRKSAPHAARKKGDPDRRPAPNDAAAAPKARARRRVSGSSG